MPAEAGCTGGATETVEGIPLYLIPRVIAEQIKKKRETVFCIRVERRFNHRYTIVVVARDEYETKAKLQDGGLPLS
jgi:hypothetical protein